MAAIEYGSYYWCVILNGKDANAPGESVHLHADSVALTRPERYFSKAPAGVQPVPSRSRNPTKTRRTIRKRTKKMKRTTTRTRKRESPKKTTTKAA